MRTGIWNRTITRVAFGGRNKSANSTKVRRVLVAVTRAVCVRVCVYGLCVLEVIPSFPLQNSDCILNDCTNQAQWSRRRTSAREISVVAGGGRITWTPIALAQWRVSGRLCLLPPGQTRTVRWCARLGEPARRTQRRLADKRGAILMYKYIT